MNTATTFRNQLRHASHKRMYADRLWAFVERASVGGRPTAELSPTYVACIDKSNGVTSEMLDCISAELTRQDARLNENYQRLLSKLSAKRKRGLLEAQSPVGSFKIRQRDFPYLSYVRPTVAICW